jgi:hypothetical protein
MEGSDSSVFSGCYFVVGYAVPVTEVPCFVAPVFWDLGDNASLPSDLSERAKAVSNYLFPGRLQRPTACGKFIASFDRYDIEARPGALGGRPLRGCEEFLSLSGDSFPAGCYINAFYWSLVGSTLEHVFVKDEFFWHCKTELLGSVRVRQGDPCIYAFRHGDGSITCGDKALVAKRLRSLGDLLREYPGTFLDVASFLEDPVMLRQGDDLLESIMAQYPEDVRADTLRWSKAAKSG